MDGELINTVHTTARSSHSFHGKAAGKGGRQTTTQTSTYETKGSHQGAVHLDGTGEDQGEHSSTLLTQKGIKSPCFTSWIKLGHLGTSASSLPGCQS